MQSMWQLSSGGRGIITLIYLTSFATSNLKSVISFISTEFYKVSVLKNYIDHFAKYSSRYSVRLYKS